MAVTIRDVARRAHVSVATVSRALTSPELVRPETRSRVLAAASDLGYQPNRAARGLITGKTGNIGIVVPDLDNPFFTGVLKAVQARAMQAQPRKNPEESLRQLENAIRQQLAGSARHSVAGDRVTVTLSNTPPAALAQWLSQVRANARAIPAEAKLSRNPSGGWDGSLVLTLPAR